jgi:SAM-dependent methyltransferase
VNSFHLQFCASPEWRQTIEETILPRALQGVDLGATVLEIGPGPGFTTDVLRRRVEHLTAVEVDVDLAQALAARLAGTNVDVVTGDAGALDFPDDHFSGAASFQMLHHIETDDEQNAVFRELARVLRPGGTLVAADGVENDPGLSRRRHLQPDRPRGPPSAPGRGRFLDHRDRRLRPRLVLHGPRLRRHRPRRRRRRGGRADG